MTKLMTTGVALIAAAALLFVGARAFDAQAATKTVEVGDIFFRDTESNSITTTINVGDTVQWNWIGTQPHSVTANDSSFDEPAGNFKTSGSFSFVFNTGGSYAYACRVHPQMTGNVVVQAAATNTPAPDNTATRTRTPEPTDTAQATGTAAPSTPLPAATSTPPAIAPAPDTDDGGAAGEGAAPSLIAPATGSGDASSDAAGWLTVAAWMMAAAGTMAVALSVVMRRVRG